MTLVVPGKGKVPLQQESMGAEPSTPKQVKGSLERVYLKVEGVRRWPSNVVLSRTPVPGRLKFCPGVEYVPVL